MSPKKIKVKPRTLINHSTKKIIPSNVSEQLVPCGKCPMCLKSKQMQWIFRINQEIKYNEFPNSYFITLTYAENRVPKRKGVKTLYKRHPQLFLKRLRKAGHKIKYILVGEYGTKTSRPHYHLLCWTTANETAIEKAWSHGHIHVGKIQPASIGYVLKYILNPRQGDNEIKQKEYAVFSKGLGLAYLTPAMYNYHAGDYQNPRLTTIIDGREIPLPRYYRQKIFTKYQLRSNAVKQYYKSLRKRFDDYRYLKSVGVRHPWKERKNRMREKALRIIRRQKVKTNYELI